MNALRWLNASFRLGRFFSVEVLIYWVAALLLPLIFWLEYGRVGFEGSELAYVTLSSTLWLLFVVWVHEMGHILAARRFGVHTSHISLSPLGGLAHLNTPAPNARADIKISLAGPLVHVPWMLIAWAGREWIPHDVLRPDGWAFGPLQFSAHYLFSLNLALFLFNLLPFFPLDGGRVFRAWLSLRTHPNRATLIACRVGKVGALLIGLVGLLSMFGLFGDSWWGVILVILGISGYLTCRREMIAARYGHGPFGAERREAWQRDPDAWKGSGASATSSLDTKPRVTKSRVTRRKAREVERKAEQREALRAEVDALLDKVSRVGMSGLTPRERKQLKHASKKLASDET